MIIKGWSYVSPVGTTSVAVEVKVPRSSLEMTSPSGRVVRLGSTGREN